MSITHILYLKKTLDYIGYKDKVTDSIDDFNAYFDNIFSLNSEGKMSEENIKAAYKMLFMIREYITTDTDMYSTKFPDIYKREKKFNYYDDGCEYSFDGKGVLTKFKPYKMNETIDYSEDKEKIKIKKIKIKCNDVEKGHIKLSGKPNHYKYEYPNELDHWISFLIGGACRGVGFSLQESGLLKIKSQIASQIISLINEVKLDNPL